MEATYSAAAHWKHDFEKHDFDESSLRRFAEGLRRRLGDHKASLGLVFMAPRLFERSPQILELLRLHGQIPLLAGCSSQGLIAGGEEAESAAGLALGLYHLPGAELSAIHFTQEQIEEANGPGYWHLETGRGPGEISGWLAFADPFHLDCDGWIQQWNEAYRSLPVVGGLAGGLPENARTQVYLNGGVYEEGGVAIAFGGELGIASVISQGCTPIGETWTITKADQNLIYEIGNRPAYEVLLETVGQLPPEQRRKTRGNLFIGLVVNEYLEEFHRGDFLIRNLLGADLKSGALAVGALPRPGQSLQFQRRDAEAAAEDMSQLLERARRDLNGALLYGGCLCCCNGRGRNLFGAPGHDAGMVQQKFGPVGLAGFFCNGEIGPIGERNFLHGYTASLALFHKKPEAEGASR